MEDKLNELKTRLIEINDLYAAEGVLAWDQTTYMPTGGAEARSRQMATLAELSHTKFTDPTIGKLLDELQPWADSLPHDSDEASLIRVTRRDYELATKLPPAFVAELTNHQGRAYSAWAQARPENDFAAVEPFLEKTLELSRRYADYFPGYEHIADPLIAQHDYGMKASTIRDLFSRLRAQLVPLVGAITAQPPADDACLRLTYPLAQQEAFFLEVVKAFRYDFQRGRIDVSPHPFTIDFSITDVRFTVRYDENRLGEALFSAFHEAGHALYEQGIRQDYEGTPLADGTSAGAHESQSRLWENLVGRSRGFWSFYYSRLQSIFPGQLGDVSLDAFYRAINKVQASLIRTDADEVTYNLHVMLRFGLELDLLEGNVAVRDLPQVWRDRYLADLGIAPPDDRDGVLQDMHWFMGRVGGMFQGYTLGNILSAQFYDAALEAHPEIPREIESGQFDTLHGWLRQQIYQHGSKFTTSELVERATGDPLRIEPYMAYLREKYGALYDLSGLELT
ncbi:carboxypeptidase M32 [Chloroflexota bacterium]